MKYKNTYISALILVILLGAVAIGYFAFNKNNNVAQNHSDPPAATNDGSMSGKPAATVSSDEMVKDIGLTNELDKEKIVELGQIYKKGNIVYGAIVVKETANKPEARKLAEKYFNKIKKQYKGTKINVQVVRDGENICNLAYGF